jgi:AcrR family transcriptional regulator
MGRQSAQAVDVEADLPGPAPAPAPAGRGLARPATGTERPAQEASSGDTGPLGLRERKKLKLRHELVRSALLLFEKQGFEQTTVEDITAAVDVSPRTFFRYFARKDDVLLVDPQRKLAVMRAAVEERSPDVPILEAVREAVVALARDYALDPETTAALYRLASSEPVVAARLLEFQIGWEQTLAAELAEHLDMSPGDLRPQIIAHTALTSARLGVAEWLRGGAHGDPGATVEGTFRIAEPALRVLLDQAS